MPSSTTKAKVTKSRLLSRNAPSRLSGESMPPGERSRSPRHTIRPTPTAITSPKNPSRRGPMSESQKACTDSMTPERVRKVPRMVRLKVAITSDRFHTRSRPRRSCTSTECRYAVAHSHGRNDAFSTGSQAQKPPHPSTWYDHQAPSRIPTVRKRPREQRPAAGDELPALADPAGDERGDGEGERDGEADEPEIEHRRVERHQRVVLEQDVGPEPVGGRRAADGAERVGRPRHQREEERGHPEQQTMSPSRRGDRRPAAEAPRHGARCTRRGSGPTAGSSPPTPTTCR